MSKIDLEIRLDYEPHEWQLEIHKGLADHRFGVLVCHRRFGKALDVTTLVPLADGRWTTMGELMAGDEVIGSDGRATKVRYAHDVMHDRPCYRLRFSSGEEIVADEDHLWVTTRKKDRHNPTRLPEGRINQPREAAPRTTREIAETLRSRGENNHRIAFVSPVEYSESDLPLDPYLLGQWLGDGHSLGSNFTTADAHTVGMLRAESLRSGWRFKRCNSQNAGKATTYRINGGLQTRLRELGLVGNKHIPEVYHSASLSQRLALLRGLMDSDGCINPQGSYCENTQKSLAIADGLERLLLSLGMVAHRCIKTIKGTDYHRIGFRPLVQVFELPRKAALYVEPCERVRWQSIVAAEQVESCPVRCITVDADDGQFCVGRKYTLTHNTLMSIASLVMAAVNAKLPDARFAYVAPRLKQAKQIAWLYLIRHIQSIPGTRKHEGDLYIEFANGARITLYGASDGNEESMRGLYLDGLVVDEVAGMSAHVWGEILRPALADRKGWALFIGTPRGIDSFHDLWQRAEKDPDWFTRMYRADETDLPWLDKAELAMSKRAMSDSAYRQEFLCDWSASSDDVLITIDMVSEAAHRECPETGYAPRVLGVDVARFGDDRSVIQKRQGLVAWEPQVLGNVDNMQLAGMVAQQITEWNPDAVFIDAGRGEGVIDRLRQLRHRGIHEINFGGTPIDPQYVNKRTEMWDLMRKWLGDGGSIPNSTELKTDLCVPTYTFSSGGQMALERKEAIRKRGGRSTDLGDALALTFAMPVGMRGGPDAYPEHAIGDG